MLTLFHPLASLPNLIRFLLLLSVSLFSSNSYSARCLFVSSYHVGYAWSDGVEKGLRSVLDGKCELHQINMDTKRHKDEKSIWNAAKRAKEFIDEWNPNVVITADDNAAKYLIKPFFRDHSIPFVFCGINWSADEYEFPYSNVTGMIEVAPIKPMLKKAKQVFRDVNKAFYIGAKTLTETKNLSRIRQATDEMGISLEYRLVENTSEWLNAYNLAQKTDLVIVGSSAGMSEWNIQFASIHILTNSHKLSVTNHKWMMPVTMLGFTKLPEEQGEWAGKAALSILGGRDPRTITIVGNRKWDLWVNEYLLDEAGIKLPSKLLIKSKKFVY